MNIRFGMFTYSAGDGDLHARPMTTQNKAIDADDSLWFFMSRQGEPVSEIASQPVVNVACADPGADRYVSVSGTAAVFEDPGKVRQLWSKMAEAWFPGGVDDPHLALVRIQIGHARCRWCPPTAMKPSFAAESPLIQGVGAMDHSYSIGGLIPLLILGAPFLAALALLLTSPKRPSRRDHSDTPVPQPSHQPWAASSMDTGRM